ncbi:MULTISPECIES: UDP-N-acetylmuramate:L-alanyl-gamma-D-glutamyl-meso-diaminopimelate ligase [Psychrobacter]|uniref:UDP-N-acetylmuramate--L-alanyl-gamma-D-glutamyl-meso-2,6-diaminoheptandioate ligase n=1 Tax=Psychrobacter alimentarius TaxID=261164 RepID=A0ABM5ZUC7_9GAMM|nr:MULTISPECIES: UDP-N-acetylmuramate:L-alanyl-gamma-D-glutamyl-meso-diaminopimelate ligase [Psychrobacter]AMT95689.1 UDP-N-acetylmuramate:L-alanyl-gamma-D-glutamyl-meso-diaminopimelate ligase [Psychrobacter alimentarius]QCB31874.1 UDP-N-acetylmuramate:L-alanyl-gamma-D-glutamyl-meso-diaminopimelate ligase [Psychrobacter sp. PAMC27889]
MHIHILGICGTFMGSLALLARALGHTVTGSDANVYPPMSTQLENAGVTIESGYLIEHLQPAPDLVVVGNAMKRGMDVIEYMLDTGLRYTSGPQFLSEQVLQSRHVIAVAGTHGKTTTTTMLAWILHYAGIDTGFLIGGVPLVDTPDVHLQQIFAHSSYLGAEKDSNGTSQTGYFVIEADEYDSAFFDKRSKFVHYRPRTAILNNLEFDHADIFADLNAIQTQFHHMVRMIPSTGKIIMPAATISLEDTLTKGVWTPIWRTSVLNTTDEQAKDTDLKNSSDWQAELISTDGGQFKVIFTDNDEAAIVDWSMSGIHNVNNALVAVAAAYNVGVSVDTACAALSAFAGIKRRMELIGDAHDILVFDDFAHHPTAIATTLDGAKKKLAGRRIWAIIEPRSNTMKMGIHQDSLAESAALADHTLWYEPIGLEWGLKEVIEKANAAHNNIGDQQVLASIDAIIEHIVVHAQAGDAIVIMSNGGFEGIHQRLLTSLRQR